MKPVNLKLVRIVRAISLGAGCLVMTIFTVGAAICMVGMSLLGMISPHVGGGGGLAIGAVMTLYFLPVIALGLLLFLAAWVAHSHLRKARSCKACGCDLQKMPPANTCPGCGAIP